MMFFCGLMISGSILVGCSQETAAVDLQHSPVSASRILLLYDQLRVGMSQDQVGAILGRPLHHPLRRPDGEEDAWYIREPERNLEVHESPWGPGGILVTYRDGKLIKKGYNSRWIRPEHLEAYEKIGEREP